MGTVLESLEELWNKGKLKELEGDLDRFIRDNLPEIRKVVREGRAAGLEVARRRYMRGELTDRELIDFCVRSTLRRRGSCNPRRDIEEQRHEIEKEVWYEGERCRGPVPPERREEIARRWATSYAGQWREWRLYQLLFVWEKKRDHYVRLIAGEGE
ncbi:MAG TPA: hypothetical protein VNO22_06775 [Planctomycetota bacterium]|jgi:hypothetical protein|nr:hypothetical protein [Planctomycetota bacterium]